MNIKNLPRALKIYDDLRRPFAQNVQRLSDLTGSLYHLDVMGWEDVSVEESAAGRYPPELLSALDQQLSEALSWVGEGDFVKAREKALSLLESASL